MSPKPIRLHRHAAKHSICKTLLFFAGLSLQACVGSPISRSEIQEKLRDAETALSQSFDGVIMASQGEEVLYAKAFGKANSVTNQNNDMHHRFRVGSVSKTFTAAALAQLFDDNKLSPDDSIEQYLPGIPNGTEITLAQLLAHESGLRDFSQEDWQWLLLSQPPPSAEAVLQRIREMKPRRAPGRTFQYANVNYVLLGQIIETVSGMPFSAFVRQTLLDPLSLHDTGYAGTDAEVDALSTGHGPDRRPDDNDYDYTAILAAGGLYSTAEDMLGWCRAQNAKRNTLGWRSGQRFGRDAFWHPGNTNDYSALLVRFPEVDGCYVVLSNVGRKKPHKAIMRTLPESLFARWESPDD